MTVLELLKGKKIMVKTDVGAMVELEIASVAQNNHSEDIGPSTPENDWWPEQKKWTNFTVKFTNGYSKTYDSLNEINVH